MAPKKVTPQGDPNLEFTVTTKLGRVFQYRELDALEEFRMNGLLGADRAMNQVVSYHAFLAAGVRNLDGTFWDIPINDVQLDAAISRLGRDGFNAISNEVIARRNGTDPAKENEEAGNSPANLV